MQRLRVKDRKTDGSVKSPDAALRFILRHCGVRNSTPHSSGFARLACSLFYEAVLFLRLLKLFTILSKNGYAEKPTLTTMVRNARVLGGCFP